ncbi:MAG: hypothetical protein JXR94_03775, partial [Candidatus Hydrogenedentes bacterium]|nr:hypothetical protein [Candidatus Hydrogenedentota bacterium]
MSRRHCVVGAALLAVLGLVAAGADEAAERDFIERFALAADREAVLQELVPGTEEYYYFHCLHDQNLGRLDDVDARLPVWVERHGRTGRVREIENRQALLRYAGDPDKALAYLRSQLGLHFDHQQDVLAGKSGLPTALDPAQIGRDALTDRALADPGQRDTVAGFEDCALDWLIDRPLDPKRRRDLLERLRRPDHPGLVPLVAADLDAPRSRGFGSLEIHARLILAQLDQLLEIKPDLLNEERFVDVYLAKLRPGADEDWRHDTAARQAYLERLEAFASRLGPAHNSLRACVLYHRLVHDRAEGLYDKERFLAYLKLPRPAPYMNPAYIGRPGQGMADLGRDFDAQIRLPRIGDDEPLVHSYLARFFVEEDNYKAYETYLRDDYLKRVFAETKILNGLGDMEKWYSWMPSNDYRVLRDRVDIEFDPANRTAYGPADAVGLDVWVKNVDTLFVKVFEIDAENYYRRHQREIDTDIDLDGLVPNDESVYTYDAPPLRRVKRHFDFPAL